MPAAGTVSALVQNSVSSGAKRSGSVTAVPVRSLPKVTGGLAGARLLVRRNRRLAQDAAPLARPASTFTSMHSMSS